MALSVACSDCGRRYQADERMAGKRVRCKHCGGVFRLPVNSESSTQDVDLDLSALAEAEAGAESHSVEQPRVAKTIAPNKSRLEVPAVAAEEFAMAGPIDTGPTGRPNVPLDFPHAHLLDQWVPRVLVFGGFLWVILQSLAFTEGPAWAGYVRAATFLALYVGCMVPAGLAGMSVARRKVGYQFPPSVFWRALAIFSPPVVLGSVLWIVSKDYVGLITGLAFGTAGSFFLVWRSPPAAAEQALEPPALPAANSIPVRTGWWAPAPSLPKLEAGCAPAD